MENILAIVPARGGSKGIPRKNILPINGKPLIAYTIEAAKGSKYINKTVVSTDDKEIADISKKFGAEIPCLRPSELADDNSSTIDCIIHMVKFLQEKQNYFPDYVCILQCTSPLRNYSDIDGALEKLKKTEQDGIVSVCEAEVNPYWTNVFHDDKLEYFIKEGKKISRRQDLPQIYRINGAIYIIKTDILMKDRTIETDNMTGYIMKNEDSVDIDNLVDFKLAELLIKEREKNA